MVRNTFLWLAIAGGTLSAFLLLRSPASNAFDDAPHIRIRSCAIIGKNPTYEGVTTGDSVIGLQNALKSLGYYAAPVDGIFGDKTRAAVLAFQTSYSLVADGLVGTETMQALNDALAKRGGSFRCG